MILLFMIKRDDNDFDTVNFLEGTICRDTSYGVDFSQLIWFARLSRHVSDVSTCNKISNI